METAFPILIENSKLPLAEIYLYLLGPDWGKAPELPINDAHNVHYEKAKTGGGENEK
jgi:hypothetical protein